MVINDRRQILQTATTQAVITRVKIVVLSSKSKKPKQLRGRAGRWA